MCKKNILEEIILLPDLIYLKNLYKKIYGIRFVHGFKELLYPQNCSQTSL